MIAHAALALSLFTNTIGVNTHDDEARSAYGDYAQLINSLNYVGVGLVRDNIDSLNDSPEFALINATLGVKYDFYIALGAAGLPWQIKQIESNPKIVAAVEGLNESDAWWQTYAGQTGIAATRAEQVALYTAVHSDPDLAGAPVIQASFASLSTFPEYGNMAAYADAGNTHTYFGTGNNPANYAAYLVQLAQTVTPGKSVITTEAGYQTMPGSSNGVDQLVQSKYLMTLLFKQSAMGVASTMLFELADHFYDPANKNTEDHYGLFGYDWTPKPAAYALHNVMSILGGVGTAFGPTHPLAYDLAGLPTTAGSELLQGSNNVYYLAVWNDVRLSGPSDQTEIKQSTVTAALTLGGIFSSIKVYDPLIGTSPIQTASSTSTIAVNVPDHPIIIALSQNETGTGASSALHLEAPRSLYTCVDKMVNIPGVSFEDSALGNFTATVSTSGGTVSALNEDGLYIPGSGKQTITISGSAATVQGELATLAYTPSPANISADQLSFTVRDPGGASQTTSIPVLIIPNARATVSAGTMIAGPTGYQITAGTTALLPRVRISDLYAASTKSQLTLVITATSGALSVLNDGIVRTTPPSVPLTLNGTESQLVDELRTLSYTAGGAPGTDSVTVLATEAGGIKSTQQFGLTISAAPEL